MFSGKTEELLRRVRRAEYAGLKTILFKPALDQRYSKDEVVSHNQTKRESISVATAHEILEQVSGCDLVAIDEAQFFDSSLVEVCEQLADEGIKIIVAGLEKDYQRQGFGPMPLLMVKAEFVTKLHAICMRCGELANYSSRRSKEEGQLKLGAFKEYEALCRPCYLQGNKK